MDKLLQLLEANRGRGTKIEAKIKDNEATLYLYDVIGYDWWTDSGIRARDWVPLIDGLKADTIHVRIDSPGGDVFDARSIYEALNRHSAKVITHVDGLAASAATMIALAGDEVELAEGGFFMVHNAQGIARGTADDMLAMAALLETVSKSIATDYIRKTGASAEQVKAWMDAETWFNSDQALEAKFVDRIYTGKKVENKYDLSMFDNTPEKLKAEKPVEQEPEQSEPSAEEEADEDLSNVAREQRGRKLALIQSGI